MITRSHNTEVLLEKTVVETKASLKAEGFSVSNTKSQNKEAPSEEIVNTNEIVLRSEQSLPSMRKLYSLVHPVVLWVSHALLKTMQ